MNCTVMFTCVSKENYTKKSSFISTLATTSIHSATQWQIKEKTKILLFKEKETPQKHKSSCYLEGNMQESLITKNLEDVRWQYPERDR